ncbi:mycofactocin biosynthesis glycosyltransferase MftF [Blastococcus sp. SYSU D00813]
MRRRDGGTALLGGSPLRLLRLRPRAVDLLAADRLVVAGAAAAALAGRLLDTGVAQPDLAALPDPGTAVTVVVPVRDRTDGVRRLLAALRADPDTAGVPVLVVDDGSADAGALAAVAAAAGAQVLRSEVSRGPAAARNTGLRAARTPLVAFLDSDCVPRAGWLPPLRRHLGDPRLALVAPRVVALGTEPPERGKRARATPHGRLAAYEAAVSALDMGPRPAAVRPLAAVSYVPSAALLARREALGAGFDETMRVAEDVDLVWRLAAAGWRVRYEPAAEVAHEHPGAAGPWLRRRAFYGTGAALLAQRHGPAVAPVVVSGWAAAAIGLAVAGRAPGRLAAAGVLAGEAVRLARRLAVPAGRPPAGLAAGLVLRGTATAARTLARAATRHHWPVAAAAAALSPHARRLLTAVAVADGLAGWWPHRAQVGPLTFVAARRAEDLAYGAGLWAGALRARSPRALLPARPPRL